jgi:hypothetical protein
MYQRVLEDDLEFPMEIDQDAASFIAGVGFFFFYQKSVHRRNNA